MPKYCSQKPDGVSLPPATGAVATGAATGAAATACQRLGMGHWEATRAKSSQGAQRKLRKLSSSHFARLLKIPKRM